LLGQSKFEGFLLLRDVNQKRADKLLVAVAHYNCPIEDARKGVTNITLRESVIGNKWGGKKKVKQSRYRFGVAQRAPGS
jgi:hypothetical protein